MSSPLEIRPERAEDVEAVRAVNRSAFPTSAEAELVDRLRASNAYIPELSLVAAAGDRVVGHLLMTRAAIVSIDSESPALALAPMAVVPERQRQGIGSMLVQRALEDARSLGHELVIVVGHPEYYPRFGFTPASGSAIAAPFEVPREAFLALWLDASKARALHGTIRYDRAFDSDHAG